MHSPYLSTLEKLNLRLIKNLSDQKNEPAWMTDIRIQGLNTFHKLPLPAWGPNLEDLSKLDLQFYLNPIVQTQKSWDQIPNSIKQTFEKLGIPQAERELLAGVGAQFDSEVIYKNLKSEWHDAGVIFCSMEDAINKYPDLIKKYFAHVVTPNNNKFAALNTALWSGGSFVYVPEQVDITMPLQAYFRINARQFGQFERTLIIAQPNSFVHYVEGCSAPVYSASSLHAAVVELIALPDSHIRYTTIQNWAPHIYNLVTKRAVAQKNSRIEWIDGNFGSGITMKYPTTILEGEHAQGHLISIAVTDQNQQHDTGGNMIHKAANTRSNIIAKSISKMGGHSIFRGTVIINKQAQHSHARVQCDALLIDKQSRTDTYPNIKNESDTATLEHEASVSNLSDQQQLYLQSRGLSEQEARTMIVTGFIDLFVKDLPMEYAVEINRLIALHMENSIG